MPVAGERPSIRRWKGDGAGPEGTGAKRTSEVRGRFAEKNLRRMIQFAEVFSDREIVVTLSRQLSWSHFLAILPLKDPLQRDFYAEMCRIVRWNVRFLREKIGGMLFQGTALSRKPEMLVEGCSAS